MSLKDVVSGLSAVEEVESLRSRVAELEIQLNVAKGVLSCSANSPDMDGENHAHRANNALEQMDRQVPDDKR